MKVHAYFVCFNEEKIIASILEYYLSFCSKIFIFDNGSTDNSIEIALSYENVMVIPFDTGGKKDNSRHVQIKTQAYKDYSKDGGRLCTESADWIICCDMDEVIYSSNIIETLENYDKEGITVPQVTGFDMVSDDDMNSDIPILTQYTKGVRNSVFDKRAVFKPNFDMSYTLGCHSYGPGFELMKKTYGYCSSNKYPIALLHFKHIGGLLYESAIKNLERFDSDAIKVDESGNYSGPGSQYAFYKDKGAEFSPLLKKSTPLFDESSNVMFDNFAPCSGESGTVQAQSDRLGNLDVDLIRDAALNLELRNQPMALKLMKLALRFRPTGPAIKKKISEWEC
jgi:glycosyltransferase involved in cell wall biosynthesis